MPVPSPIFLLSSPYSHASLIGAMLGRHPAAYGAPELNLLVGDTVADTLDEIPADRIHGLLRTLAQLATGSQTLESIETARRWIYRRLRTPPMEFFKEICSRVEPLRLIDRSGIYTDPDRARALESIRDEFPGALFLHLVRHPRTQCAAWLRSPEAFDRLLTLGSLDLGGRRVLIDPQSDWLTRQQRIERFLDSVPTERRIRVRCEDILREPETSLREVCDWGGLEWNEPIHRELLHPERSAFSGLGPYGAETGSNPTFLSAPEFRRRESLPEPGALREGLPWRQDGASFLPEVIRLAAEYGYE